MLDFDSCLSAIYEVTHNRHYDYCFTVETFPLAIVVTIVCHDYMTVLSH